MPFFVPVITSVIGFVVRKRVAIVAGALIITYYDEAGKKIGEFIGEEAAEKAEQELQGLGITIKDELLDIAGGLGNATIEVIENAGVAIVKGLDNAAEYVYQRTVAGKEPEIIASFTFTILIIGAGIYLYQSVKNANDAFSN
tara:strand:+ start:766 stop:1191 length:426 start_codon:yes stop_codon:yes gene_type:complete